jgi:hypothetical protein
MLRWAHPFGFRVGVVEIELFQSPTLSIFHGLLIIEPKK